MSYFRRWVERRRCKKAGHPLVRDEWATYNFRRVDIIRSCECHKKREIVGTVRAPKGSRISATMAHTYR